ncbi:MAG: Histidine--tRNA ligase [Nitrospirae bacterium]|nr:MAG: histidyl-tRNA synthetase [Nitrospira sp. OLB3]MBV6468255.1 Histidine--tRNA ligase [Nitrospirota bacterium]MCE7963772.1 histidine--tRNA ligase [Nitrospira sp. NTP2]MCK6494085.1 histidine--tRNA ligase [Nitrospira sp.]MEB2337504.1 histidine--tRNA ligase [Nitrospirales bacterium]
MIKAIKGVKDLLPEETPRWRLIEETARRWALRYGFQEIRVPIFETTTLFARSIGATTDIVEKEMYTFPDRDGSSLTLRPEGTAGAVRAFIEHNRAADPRPQKFCYLGPMFRHERPQAGRLRQFHQFGVESFGMSDPRADVEVLSLLWRMLYDLSLPGLTLELNNLGYAEDRARYKPTLVTYLKGVEAQLCSNCRRRIDANPLRVLDCKVPECRTATDGAPRLADALSPEARAHFDRVTSGLQALGIPFHLNHRLVRGLDYYCLTAFEVTCSHLGAQNAVGAGGRYDGLVEQLGGPVVPAVGFAVGLERIALMLPEESAIGATPRVYVAAFGTAAAAVGFTLLDELRRTGVPADMDFRAASLKAHLRQADRLRSLYAVILGDDEVAQGRVTIRNMQTKAQEEITLSEVSSTLQTRLLTP